MRKLWWAFFVCYYLHCYCTGLRLISGTLLLPQDTTPDINIEEQNSTILDENVSSQYNFNEQPLPYSTTGNDPNSIDKEKIQISIPTDQILVQNEDKVMTENHSVLNVSQTIPTNMTNVNESSVSDNATIDSTVSTVNATQTVNNVSGTVISTEEMPTFNEWTEQQIAAAERQSNINNGSEQNATGGGANASGGGGGGGGGGGVASGHHAHRQNGRAQWKNYASMNCGAKVVGANPEAVSVNSILSQTQDEYKLNPCASRIWFVIELCETIQAKRIELGNLELYASSPENFTVSMTDRYPTREWTLVGQFTAADKHQLQSFDLTPRLFGKYIKVDVKSHYGSEHFCPISVFRVYGTSEFEMLQKEHVPDEPRIQNGNSDDDSDDTDDVNDVGDSDDVNLTSNVDGTNPSGKNDLLSSATNAVLSMVKKAAQVLSNNHHQQDDSNKTTNSTQDNSSQCQTPIHPVICTNCSQAFHSDVTNLISCQVQRLQRLLAIPIINYAIRHTDICHEFVGISMSLSNDVSKRFAHALLARSTITAALCNLVMTVSTSNLTASTNNDNDDNVTVSNAMPLDNLTLLESVLVTDETHYVASSVATCSTTIDTSPTLMSIHPTLVTTADPVTTSFSDENTTATSSGEFFDLDDGLIDQQQAHQQKEIRQQQPQQEMAPPPNKESVFLRLSNRIRILERNMSLSSQYMEELSRRYKKQMEDLKSLEKTLSELTEANRKQDEVLRLLNEHLNTLNDQVVSLSEESSRWSLIFSVIFAALVVALVFCMRLRTTAPVSTSSTIRPINRHQRHASDSTVTCQNALVKMRRPSEHTCAFVTSSPVDKRRRQRHTKRQMQLQRSQSTNTLQSLHVNSANDQTTINNRKFSYQSPCDVFQCQRVEEMKIDEKATDDGDSSKPMKNGGLKSKSFDSTVTVEACVNNCQTTPKKQQRRSFKSFLFRRRFHPNETD